MFIGNVVCQDHISAALALLVHSREIRDENLKQMLDEKPNHHWREGMPHPKKDLILMRFATNGDKKVMKKKQQRKNVDEFYDQSMDSISKNPWGDLCKSWGVYDHQEVFHNKPRYRDEDDDYDTKPEKVIRIKNKSLASRLGKRHVDNDDNQDENPEDSASDSEWKIKSKTPRMRMHADDEESKQKKKLALQHSKDEEEYSALSIEVDSSGRNYVPREYSKLSDKFKKQSIPKKVHGIQSRLGDKVVPYEGRSLSSDESSQNSDSIVMSRVHKVNNTNSVWSRLEIKTANTSAQSDLRQILKSRKHKKNDDLRDKLGKSKQTNLRIEIDNNYAHDL